MRLLCSTHLNNFISNRRCSTFQTTWCSSDTAARTLNQATVYSFTHIFINIKLNIWNLSFNYRQVQQTVSLLQNFQTSSVTRPASYNSWYSLSFPGAKRPWHEAHISSPLNSEAKKERNTASAPQYMLHGVESDFNYVLKSVAVRSAHLRTREIFRFISEHRPIWIFLRHSTKMIKTGQRPVLATSSPTPHFQ